MDFEMEDGLEGRNKRGKARPAGTLGAKGLFFRSVSLVTATGSNTVNITNPGNARTLVGINFWNTNNAQPFSDETISLTVNSETLLQQNSIKEFSPADHVIAKPVIEINRPLKGTDEIQLSISTQGAGGVPLNATIYYLPY